MQVCCFCEKWESGGIEAFLTNALERMDFSGLTVELVTCQKQKSVYDRRLDALHVTVTVLSGSTRRVAENLRLFRALLRKNRYDAVHLNLYEGLALLFAREAKNAGVSRVIVHSHNTDLRPGLLRPAKLFMHRLCVKRLSRYADVRLAPSEAAAQFLFGSRPYALLRNGIGPERFSFSPAGRAETRSALGLTGEFLIGCVGRLCAQKNQAFLLEVLKSLPGAVLLLVGEGEDEAMLRQKACAAGLLERVIFYGTAEEVAPLYWAMDAFCLPSRFEALGIAAVEAQAAGLYTLCSPEIPPEAAATPLLATAPLDASAWAALLSAAGGGSRADMAEAIRAAGYDMADTAARLRAAYGGEPP